MIASERPNAGNPISKVHGYKLGVIAGLEPVPLVLVVAPELVIVGQLAIVDDANIRKWKRPERMGVVYVHHALGGHSYVADSVCAP